MSNQNLIIYNFKSLYLILEELEEYLNFKILDVPNINDLNDKIKNSKNNIPKLIEINPRIGGTIILPSVSGINLPYLAIKQCLNEKIPTIKKSKEMDNVLKHLKNAVIIKNIYIKNKLVNFITKK